MTSERVVGMRCASGGAYTSAQACDAINGFNFGSDYESAPSISEVDRTCFIVRIRALFWRTSRHSATMLTTTGRASQFWCQRLS